MRFSILAVFLIVVPSVGSSQAVTFEEEAAVARKVLTNIQPKSISENVEYCGVIGLNAGGKIVASLPTRGDEGSCLASLNSNIVVETASYHTHGAYSPDYVNEVPSVDDIDADVAEGVDGYIATPSGRFWYNDTEAEEVFQICGPGCLPSDPQFVRGSDGEIYQSYSYSELVSLFSD